MTSTIVLDQVSWQRKGRTILDEINWQVEPGQHWAILGLNGSGKTSLLNIVTGYHFPSQGQVRVLETEFGRGSIRDLRKEIGFVSSSLNQFLASFNRQRVEGVVISGKFASVGIYEEVTEADYRLADDILADLNLTYLKGQFFRTLSQGESRRVLIARALMAEPRLLILDEPCSGLDILAREQVLDLMESISQRDCQLIYVTHYLEEITETITHALLIRDGQIVAQGPKHEVLTGDYLSETFKLAVDVNWQAGRPWLSIQS